MQKLFLKKVLFFSPFLALVFAEIFLFPIHFFCHRPWEALVARDPKLFSGAFYPNQTLSMQEEGDLAYRTPFAIKKKVTWVTDEYGFRNLKESAEATSDIVIVGESSVVGSSLDQNDTLAEQLESMTRTAVYPYAPKTFQDFIRDDRFQKSPPKSVILAVSERVLDHLPQVTNETSPVRSSQKPPHFLTRVTAYDTRPKFLDAPLIIYDRIIKSTLFHFCRSRLHQAVGLFDPVGIIGNDGKTLFLKADLEKAIQQEEPFPLQTVVEQLVQYQAVLRQRGIQFIFVAIPNKSTIYYDRVPSAWGVKKSRRLKNLSLALTKSGVSNIDLQTVFEEAYEKKGTEVYQFDDSHWNPLGVKMTSEILLSKLRQREELDQNAQI